MNQKMKIIGTAIVGCSFFLVLFIATNIHQKSPSPEQKKATEGARNNAGFDYIDAPEDFDWRQFQGITLDFVVENNINANILTRECGDFINATGININIRPMDYDTFIEKINIDFISKTSKYELIYADPYQTLNRFYDSLADLNQYIQDPRLPQISGWPEDFYQNQVDAVCYFLDREKLYTVPFDTTTMILFYRKDIFEKYQDAFYQDKGYDWTPGTRDFTWERYCEIATWIDQNVPDAEVKYGSGHMAQLHNSLYCDFSNVMASYGADYFDDENAGSLGVKKAQKIGVRSKGFIKALRMYQAIIRASSPESITWDWVSSAEAFKNGEIAMMPNWDENWAAIENKALSKVAGNVGYSILPYGDVRSANIYGGAGIGVNKNATEEKRKAAWLFIVWLASKNIQRVVLNDLEGGNIPPRISLCEDENVLQETHALQMKVVLTAWEKENIYFRPKIENFYEVEQIIIKHLHDLLKRNVDPVETASQIYRQIEQLQ